MSTQRFLRRFSLALAGVLSLSLGLSALGQTNYYVSQSGGDDGNAGTAQAKPWKTLAKASGVTYRPGDKLLLKCGDIWDEMLTLRGEGAADKMIAVASYGEGHRPYIRRTPGGKSACVIIDKASGFHISGLELAFAQNAIRFAGDSRAKKEMRDFLIEDCFMHDIIANPDFRGGNHEQYVHMGWVLYSDGSGSPEEVRVKNLTVRHCAAIRVQGFFFANRFSFEDVLFDGITMAHTSFNPIYHAWARNFDIVNCVLLYNYPWEYHPNGTTQVLTGGLQGDDKVRNEVVNNEFGWAGEYPGRPDGCAYDFEVGSQSITFQGNFVHNTFGEAVLFMGNKEDRGLRFDGNIFRNNVRFSPRWHHEVTIGAKASGVVSNNRFFSRRGIQAFTSKPASCVFTNNDEHATGEFVEMPLVTRIVHGAGERTYTLASRTPGATIRYTTNGSLPTASSTLYAGPVTVRRSGMLNVKAFKDGCLPSYVNSLGVELRNREGEGLVACWKLDETSGTTVADSAGGKHGTLSGCKWTRGKLGGSLQFIRAEDKVALDSAKLMNITNDFTITFWANPKVPRAANLIQSSFSHFPIGEAEGGEGGKAGQRYALSPKDPGIAGGAGVGVSVGVNGIGVYERAEGYLPPVLTLDTPLTGWNHITVVYRIKQPTIYLNGVFEKAGLKSGRAVRPAFDFGGAELGRYVGGLDDVRLYDRALTDGEVQENYNLHLVEGPRRAVVSSTNASPVKTIPADGAWKGCRMRMDFSGYRKGESLTDFPVLVLLGTNRAGFAYSQFLSTNGWDLRFSAADGTTELPYEIEKWNPSGVSYVWVCVPELSSNAWITASWGDPARTARESYTSDGSVWLSGYVTVAHFDEAEGPTRDSTDSCNDGIATNGVTRNVAGVVGGGCAFDGKDGRVQFDTVGRPANNFTFGAWIRTEATHENDPESVSTAGGTSGQKFAFSPDHGGGDAGSGLSVGSNGIGVYEHGNSYMPALTVATNAIGAGWNYISVVYANRQPAIYVNGVCVRKNGTSSKTVYAPYAIGGMVYGYFAGSMDEVRVSGVSRSADWVWAEYLNMASNDVFAAYGMVEQAKKK